MPRIWVCFGGVWNESKMDYDGGELRGCDVDTEITYNDFLGRIYSLSSINPNLYDLVIRCIVQLKSRTPAFVIRNDEDLLTFLTWGEVSTIPLYISSVSKLTQAPPIRIPIPYMVPNNSHPCTCKQEIPMTSTSTLFSQIPKDIPSTQIYTSMPPLYNNVVAYNLRDDADHVIEHHNANDFGETRNFAEDSDGDDDGGEEGDGSGEEIHVERNVENIINVSSGPVERVVVEGPPASIHASFLGQSTEDIKVGEIFMTKKALCTRLSIIAMKMNFEFKPKKSNKTLCVLICRNVECKWRLRAMKLKDCDRFKVTQYCNIHTCLKIMLTHNHRLPKSVVLGHLLKSKFENVGCIYKAKDIINDIRKEYGVNLTYDTAWRARQIALRLACASSEKSSKLPPEQVVRVGQRQTLRTSSAGKTQQVHKCSRCGNLGHNKKTCRQPLTTE